MPPLMPDSRFPKTERGVQLLFRKSSSFSYLALAIVILVAHYCARALPNRGASPDAAAAVRFTPAHFDPAGFAPLRLAGAWQVEVGDPRFGGVSAMAIDQGGILALTDAGALVRLPLPGTKGAAIVRDLPAGPGSVKFKWNRDSEALARDPGGRGWWVAFEPWPQLWLYDPAFRRPLRTIDLGAERWSPNKGIEALVADAGGMTAFREPADEWLRIEGGRVRSHSMASDYGWISDAARLPDGRVVAVTRSITLTGFAKKLVAVETKDGSAILRPLADLSLGARDNVEAIAAEPRADGGTRLWMMTDNDFRSRAPTLLVALDLS